MNIYFIRYKDVTYVNPSIQSPYIDSRNGWQNISSDLTSLIYSYKPQHVVDVYQLVI